MKEDPDKANEPSGTKKANTTGDDTKEPRGITDKEKKAATPPKAKDPVTAPKKTN